MGRSGRAALLASLGGGWASRRALCTMIGEGVIPSLDEALALVASLARPGQQTGCLADLMARDPSPAERERVLAAAPTDAARRRLASR